MNFTVTLLLRTTRMRSRLLGSGGLAIWRLHKQTNKQKTMRAMSVMGLAASPIQSAGCQCLERACRPWLRRCKAVRADYFAWHRS